MHPTILQGTAPYNKGYQPQMSMALKLRNPVVGRENLPMREAHFPTEPMVSPQRRLQLPLLRLGEVMAVALIAPAVFPCPFPLCA